MNQQVRWRLWSFLISLGLVVGFSAIGYLLPTLDVLSVIAAPGLLAALVLFPQRGHSDWAYVYIVVAVIVDALLYTWPILLAWRFFATRFSK